MEGETTGPAVTITAPRGGPPAHGLAEVAPGPAPASAPHLPPSLAVRYEIVRLLGRGGMGVVYEARDLRLGRHVALKLLPGGDPERTRRLLREARSQARLDHPDACQVFEAGEAGGTLYIVMQRIDGAPWGEAAQHMTIEEQVAAARRVALALHEAHRIGLVHRDVKPGNVIVERAEDGSYHPYLVDFGIAREVGEEGLTESGAIAGTPAFMAPEQARGEIRALDRRTDVYGLGATLYTVLAGRPPFGASGMLGLLQQIAGEEAPPIRRVRSDISADLEAILARCLETDPARRYDSARALAEDLQRLLDGDPVRARRRSPGYVLLRKAQKHRGVVALAGAALAVVLVLAAFWARAQWLAAERADLDHEMGEDVKEMELFLRSAYGLPLHDVERERDVLRARLSDVEARVRVRGPAAEGPGRYALGRGYLALHEPEAALAHLQAASAAGYASPDLEYALGAALGELWTRAVAAAKREADSRQQEARLAAADAQYKAPALVHLRSSAGARLSSTDYAEGLIALYEGREEVALLRARAAAADRPWLYEARKLEGDALFARGSRFRYGAAFDHDRMMASYGLAAEAYRAAAEIGRSDPEIYLGACEIWIQVMSAASAHPATLRESSEKAQAACGQAIAASSRSEAAHLRLAFISAPGPHSNDR
jgi:serine/threonine-protein kinase